MGIIAKVVVAFLMLCGFILTSVGCNEKILEKIEEICEQLNPTPDEEPPPEDPDDGGDPTGGTGTGL